MIYIYNYIQYIYNIFTSNVSTSINIEIVMAKCSFLIMKIGTPIFHGDFLYSVAPQFSSEE